MFCLNMHMCTVCPLNSKEGIRHFGKRVTTTMWVLGNEPQSSARAVSDHTQRDIFPVPAP